MFLVWVINPYTHEDVPLTDSFESLQEAFDHKELLAEEYPELRFFHTTGIIVSEEQRKPFYSAISNV